MLTLFPRFAGSSAPYVIQSQSELISQTSIQSEAEDSRWFAQLNSSDQEKRREAVMELSHVEGAAATQALLSALDDRSSRVRAAAAAGLGKRREPSAVPLLAGSVSRDKDAFVRKMAAYALGGFSGSERTAALIAALRDKDDEVRGAAAVSLGEFADAEAIAPLTAALSDKNPFVTAHAARALGVNGPAAKQSVPVLIRLLSSHEDGEVRRKAATALGLIGDPSAHAALDRARHDKDPHLVLAATEALKLLK